MKRTVHIIIVLLILIGSIFLGCSGSHVKYISNVQKVRHKCFDKSTISL